MARVNVMAVLLLLVMSFVTSDAHTIFYASSIAVGVDTSSGEDVSTVDVKITTVDVNGPTSDEDLSTVDLKGTTLDDNGPTSDEDLSTVDVKSTTVDDNGPTSDKDLSTVDVKSTTVDDNGPTSDEDLSTVDVKSTTVDDNGPTSDEDLSTVDVKSTTVDDNEPTSDEDVSTVDVKSTTVDDNGPTSDEDLSTVDVKSTTVDDNGPTSDEDLSTVDVKSTTVDDNGPTSDEDLSTVDVKSTVTDESSLTTYDVITSTVDVLSTKIAGTGSTTDGGSGEVISTTDVKSTQNGETSLATDGEPNEVTSTVDAQMSETAGNGQTTDSQESSSPDLGVTSQDGKTSDVAVTVTSQDGSTPDVVVTVTSQDGSSPDVVVTSQDESTAVAGVTTVITEQMTTSSVTVTAPVVTTPTVPSTTTTLPPNYQPPNFDAAPPFLMTFDIGFDKVWDESFSSESCQLNDECVIFISVVNIEINKAFENCPGYKSNSAMVLSFRQGSESQITQQRMQSSIYLEQNPAVDATVTCNENCTYATYNTSFDNEQILINSALVLNYIDIVAVPYLQTADFDGVGVLNESLTNMTIAATSQMSQFTENACPAIGPFVCSTCFPCTPDNGSASTISCLRSCGENEICTVTASDTIGCTCKANYLPVAGDCVDQNIIIGVSAGVGGAILLALIIALICVACKLDKKDKDYDHLLKTQEYRPTPYTVAKVHDTERGDDYTVIDGVRHSAASDDGNEIELRSFHNVIETDSASVAAAAVAVHASQHPALDADSHQSNESLAVRSGHVKQELKPDYDNPSLHSVAAVKEPSSSSHQLPNQKSNEHYRSLYYPQPSDDDSSKEEDPYAGFVPRLAGVDTQNEYIIARPKYGLQPTTNFKDINSQFF